MLGFYMVTTEAADIISQTSYTVKTRILIDPEIIGKRCKPSICSRSRFLIDSNSSRQPQQTQSKRGARMSGQEQITSNRNRKELKTSVTPRFLRKEASSNRGSQQGKMNKERMRPTSCHLRPKISFLIENPRLETHINSFSSTKVRILIEKKGGKFKRGVSEESA